MFLTLSLFSAVLLPALFQSQVSGVLVSDTDVLADEDYCNFGTRLVIKILTSGFPVEVPVIIDQYFDSNTIIDVDFFGLYTITNAPTSIVTTVVGTSRTTVTTTSTTTTTVTDNIATTIPITPPQPAAFMLGIEPLNNRRRQEQGPLGYVGFNGTRTASCVTANQFFFNGMRLQDAAGRGFISTNTGDQFATLTPSRGNITTALYALNQVLVWNNTAFSGGLATFFYNEEQNVIEAVFNSSFDIAGLLPVQLVPISASKRSDIAPVVANSTILPSTTLSVIPSPTSKSTVTPPVTAPVTSSTTPAEPTPIPSLGNTTQNGVVTIPEAVSTVKDDDSTIDGKNVVYEFYEGDGSVAQGWPSIDEWASFESIFANNMDILKTGCQSLQTAPPSNHDYEIAAIREYINVVAARSKVDHRYILATILQESKGCVRVPTTSNGVNNPGLMQCHDGAGSCNKDDQILDPCPDSIIQQMIEEGTGGTYYTNSMTGAIEAGEGLVQALNRVPGAFGTEGAQTFYIASRNYNSGAPFQDKQGKPILELGCATHCYSSDIANRLVGWVESSTNTNSKCADRYPTPDATHPDLPPCIYAVVPAA